MMTSNIMDEIATKCVPSPFQCDPNLEEERLRSDIFRYLEKISDGCFDFSVALSILTREVVGKELSCTPQELKGTEHSLLDLLNLDPRKRFSIIGTGDNIFIKRAPLNLLDPIEISNLIEDWMSLIANFLLTSKRFFDLTEITSRYQNM
jgi:hypothetical protein